MFKSLNFINNRAGEAAEILKRLHTKTQLKLKRVEIYNYIWEVLLGRMSNVLQECNIQLLNETVNFKVDTCTTMFVDRVINKKLLWF